MNSAPANLETTCVNTIRGLSMDAVQRANSGHPGMPMGCAALAHALWANHLRHNPKNPKWFDRDRFVLSAGHGSMLLYSLLFLTGYDLTLDDIKAFRQWGSKTPGHPENTHTPGVEMATGPLGQGISTAVGMAIAERFLSAKYNRPGHEIVGHRTFVIASDGDLMEGISNEACSLAGHLKLGKMIVLYDDNKISIDGSTDITFTDDTQKRFEALGWRVLRADGMEVAQVDRSLAEATSSDERPTLIICRTVIGYGSPHKANSQKAHGAPLGVEEVKLAKEALGIPVEPDFYVPEEALTFYREAVDRGEKLESEWDRRFAAYESAFPAEAAELKKAIAGDVSFDWASVLPRFEKAESTRTASQVSINALTKAFPTLVGGSADLAESVYTVIHDGGEFQPETPTGRNICFGVREHGMMAAVNGITLHGGVRAFGGTFLVFSDYCRPSIRLAALMQCPSIFVFSHDSIGLGEDGPTHQPVEHVMSLRTIPKLNVMRPADANETAACWRIAMESRTTPSLLVLTRQGVPLLTPGNDADHPARHGAYVLQEAGSAPKLVFVATGSEVQLAVGAREVFESEGIPARVVSMPSWLLFERESESYRRSVLPAGIPTISIEAGTTLGWDRYAQAHVGLDRFGASAPGPLAMKEFGFTVENVVAAARKVLA